MGNFNNRNRSSSRNNFGRRDFGRPSFGGPRENRGGFQAVCSSCGNSCTLPFQPNGSRPVYCNDCFRKNNAETGDMNFRDGAERRPGFVKRPDYRSRPDFDRKPDFKPQNNEQFAAINRKLDKIMELLAVQKPVLVKTAKIEPETKPVETAVAAKRKTKKMKNAKPVAAA